MEMYQDIRARQIWTDPGHPAPHCDGYRLPAPGSIIFNDSYTVTLAEQAIYEPACTSPAGSSATGSSNETVSVYTLGDPFDASVVPQMFVLGAMLVIAWALVIILVITPRTSFVLGTGVGHLGRANGNSATVITVGGRPWLQKFAAFTVGVSLFIATVNSFKIIQEQYAEGYQDATAVTNGVVDSLEVRIIRVISTTFVWLAQVQTLIRLFPRHREKVIIKWAGFGLIVLDTIFVILYYFVSHNGNGPLTSQPRAYTQVIPVLSYLFELSLNLLYAAWVIYYSFVKRRYAFLHPQMRNIALVALLSYISVLIPVVFFITDIAKPEIQAWGDYIRWVGSAAASVVVWEWVERIEALEKEERKNGILGREIFDGDENFGSPPNLKFPKWPRRRSRKSNKETSSNSDTRPSDTLTSTESQPQVAEPSQGIRLSNILNPGSRNNKDTQNNSRPRKSLLHTFRPQRMESPVPRSDTGSAASTVYAVVHHPPSSSTTPAQDPSRLPAPQAAPMVQGPAEIVNNPEDIVQSPGPSTQKLVARSSHFLPALGNPFKRQRSSPPPEVSRAAVDASGRPSQARWSSRRSPKHLFRLNRPQTLPADLPIVVVPAQPRGHIWTPPVDDTEENYSEKVEQDTRSSQNTPGHTPLSLDSSLRDSPDGNDRASHSAVGRGSPPAAGSRGGEFLSTGHSVAAHSSDRAYSPLSILPRVDEQIEQTESDGIHIDNSNRGKNSSPPAMPPAG